MQVRKALLTDVSWIVSLSERVQAALTASGSLQQIGPLPTSMVERAVQFGNVYVLEIAPSRLGSVLVEPVAQVPTLPLRDWNLDTLPAPLWYLHALMLEPMEQGKGYGWHFLQGVKQLVVPTQSTIILDCFAGNEKLRNFYLHAGFLLHDICREKDYEVAVFFYSALSHNSKKEGITQ
jgi:GNAT superfamily N-acetyltransferase